MSRPYNIVLDTTQKSLDKLIKTNPELSYVRFSMCRDYYIALKTRENKNRVSLALDQFVWSQSGYNGPEYWSDRFGEPDLLDDEDYRVVIKAYEDAFPSFLPKVLDPSIEEAFV